MKKISNPTRIGIGLTLLTLSVLTGAYALGLAPKRSALESEHRLRISEAIAIQFSVGLDNDDPDQMLRLAGSVMGHTPEIHSLAVRRTDGSSLFSSPGHDRVWQTPGQRQRIEVPLRDGDGADWGSAELLFSELPRTFVGEWGLFAFIAAACLPGFVFYMRHTLRALDPSKVVPARVRDALDTLSEGALVIDLEDRIMLANRSLAEMLSCHPDDLLGVTASTLGWMAIDHDQAPESLPWAKPAAGQVCRGASIRLRGGGETRTLTVNATPVLGAGQQVRGTLVTLDDVTAVEEKNRQLVEMVRQLGEAQERLNRQNDDLKCLATRDALTGCLNRRAFQEQLATLMELAGRRDEPFSAMMVDVDHFKQVNDQRGHAAGDAVLRGLGTMLIGLARASDVVCRYGGEEFCILMPDTTADGAAVLAEKIRRTLRSEPIADLKVTASFGVAEIDAALRLDMSGGEKLIDRADAALYAAKEAGRDRVACFDAETIHGAAARHAPAESLAPGDHIPIHAVSALFAALRYRDPQTAEHCRRVADLCVRFCVSRMSTRDLFVMEVAAMLHDIGKIGVPDAILLKPGELDEHEWAVMERHDRIGIEILGCFDCPEMIEIVRHHHAFFDESAGGVTGRKSAGRKLAAERPTGGMPLRARVLSIADAYDAMVTDRVYRSAMPREAAFVELRRCAGTQFDPALTEAFIAMVQGEHGQIAGQSQLEFDLRIGLEVERLSGALLRRDVPSIGALAQRLQSTAASLGRDEIARIADRVGAAAEVDFNLENLLGEVNDLLAICQSASRRGPGRTADAGGPDRPQSGAIANDRTPAQAGPRSQPPV